ncbi:MAG: SH3 domain-containing protein [Saprospiraceae bacterium]|nr:SH3 domain-containing protein [Saprospiraceae bacterium]
MKLPKVETLVIIAFFGCVLLWAVSKCSAKRSDLVRSAREITDDDGEERPARHDTIVVQQPAQQPAQTPVNIQGPGSVSPAAATSSPPVPAGTTPGAVQPAGKPVRPVLSNQTAATTAAPPASASKYPTLFVTIDGLKVRKEPGLKGESIAKLELYEPVTFLNQKTEWTQEISLGYEKVTDHWVKIRTKSGKDGWVFGAGVHYYKMKRKGVMD